MALVALAAVAAAVVLFGVTSLGSSKQQPPASTTNAPTRNSSAGAAFTPASVTVAVLNGTPTNQLAHRVASKLASGGYKQGTIATAPEQTETKTVVGYVAGARNRADALHVASALGLRPSAVRAVDQSTLQVACPVPAACKANVVVTVGADLARS